MPVADRQLRISDVSALLLNDREVERRHEAGPVRSRFAMNEDRLWRGSQDLHQLRGAFGWQLSSCPKTEVDVLDAHLA